MAWNNKALFKEFSLKQEEKLTFSMKYSWWDEVVQENWKVAVVHHEGQVKGIWPYYLRRKWPWRMIAQAHLSPYCGPHLVYPEGQKLPAKISFEHKMHQALLEQIPPVEDIDLSFPLHFENGLAFQWAGFEESRKYTYLLSLKAEKNQLWSGLRENIRRQVRKAEKLLEVKKAFDAQALEGVMQESFARQQAAFPLPNGYIERVVNYLQKYRCGVVYQAVEGNHLTAALAVIYDAHLAYYLIGAS
jgi:hypothetical protein